MINLNLLFIAFLNLGIMYGMCYICMCMYVHICVGECGHYYGVNGQPQV